MENKSSHSLSSLGDRIRQATGEAVSRCYQCGKCAAGCPLAEEMDIPPSRILRLVQLGLPELEAEALRSYSIWLCLACETCATRCPQEVELPKIMDFLREEAIRRRVVNPRAKGILAFHRSFLDTIRHLGRLYEIGLIAAYKTRTRRFFQDVTLVPGLLRRGKLPLWPHRIRGRGELARLFDRSRQVPSAPHEDKRP